MKKISLFLVSVLAVSMLLFACGSQEETKESEILDESASFESTEYTEGAESTEEGEGQDITGNEDVEKETTAGEDKYVDTPEDADTQEQGEQQ